MTDTADDEDDEDVILGRLRDKTKAKDEATAAWDAELHTAFHALPHRRPDIAQAAGLGRTTLYQRIGRHPEPLDPASTPADQPEHR